MCNVAVKIFSLAEDIYYSLAKGEIERKNIYLSTLTFTFMPRMVTLLFPAPKKYPIEKLPSGGLKYLPFDCIYFLNACK